MRLSLPQAQVVCCVLLACDLAARAWRIRLLLRGVGHRLGLGKALVVNSIGDVASALTPMRFGGEPARLGAMLRTGVPLGSGLVALGAEVAVEWPTVGAVALGLAWLFGGSWWRVAAPALLARLGNSWPWAALAVAACAFALWAGLRGLRRARQRMSPAVDDRRRRWRPRWWALLAAAPLTLISVTARVALLPVLALTLPEPPPLGALAFGSFALLYGQLLVPTPSGAGAVDLAFLGGAAGDLGPSQAALLILWRLDTLGVSALLGSVLALRIYGRAGLVRILTWLRSRREAPAPEARVP